MKSQQLKSLSQRLQQQVREIDAEASALQTRDQSIISDNRQLKTQVRQLDAEVSALQTKYQSIISDNRQLKTQVRELEAKASALQKKYSPIISQEEIIAKLQNLIKSEQEKLNISRKELQQEERILNKKLKTLKEEIAPLEEHSFFISFGFYESKYDFNESVQYQNRLDEIKNKQKALIKNSQAVSCNTQWTIGDSKSEGKKMISNISKLILRAFNGECDSCIAKVRYNNIKTMETRIKKTCDTLNKLGSIIHAHITNEFLNLKLQELWLVHEYQEKKQAEIEEQRLIREQMKEEQKAQKEIEKALKEAEKEEQIYQRALEEAKEKLAQDSGKNSALLKQIAALEEKLHEAEANKERATSQAQLTKSGYVYVISNLGSFGENVYKIGMTRRLEPMDRVKELSNASVPFPFDVHAMIYCENAPEMESNLHKYFDDTRVNKSNRKKEFFQVSIEEIVEAVKTVDAQLKTCKSEIQFTKIAEAQEYRKTLAASLSDSD